MYPAQFDYYRPTTIDEAVKLLAQHGEDAKLLAGGHSLIPAMKLRLARPKTIVDLVQQSQSGDGVSDRTLALRRTQLLAHERQARPCTSPSR